MCEQCKEQTARHRVYRPFSYYHINLCCTCYAGRRGCTSGHHPPCNRAASTAGREEAGGE